MDTGTKKEVPAEKRSFSNLPPEILSSIADRLPMIELLGFRGTCNDFRSASSTASAAIESLRSPWLLFHKTDSSECLIYNDEESKTYNRNIPDLKGAVCLASYHGWLLLYKDESIFFFCPFSLAKIVLPDFPHKQIDGHVAAFSDVPTSDHCIVSVINGIDEASVEVNVISKGQTAWTPHMIPTRNNFSSSISAATFDEKSRNFYYMDDGKTMLSFSVKDKKWKPYTIVKGAEVNKDMESMPYCYKKHVFRNRIEDTRDRFNLEDDEYVAVCGLSYESAEDCHRHVYLNEVVDDSPSKKRVRRAVWIQPRFFEAHPNQLRW